MFPFNPSLCVRHTTVIAVLKQRTSSFFYYTSTLPLPSPPFLSRSPTYSPTPNIHASTSTMTLLPYFPLYHGPVAFHLYCGHGALLPPIVALFPYLHIYCGPVALLPLLPYFLLPYSYLYRSPVALRPPLVCTCCLTFTSTVHLLQIQFSTLSQHIPIDQKFNDTTVC